MLRIKQETEFKLQRSEFNYNIHSLNYVCQNHCNNRASGLRLLAEQTKKNRLWIGGPRDKNKAGKELETQPMASLPQAVLYS